VLAILAPGQGSQSSGFLSAWLSEANPWANHATSLINSLSTIIELDLTHLGCVADNDEIRSTDKAQPLLVVGGIIGALSLFHDSSRSDLPISEITNNNQVLFAGHSVGEITAMAVSGKLSAQDAAAFVALRGREMAKAASVSDTGMSAVLGGERADVIASLAQYGLTPANENGAGQIVAAGSRGALAELEANPPAGARVRPLAVAGAFHTSTMDAAVAPLHDFAKSLTVHSTNSQLITNKDASLISDASEFLALMVGQINSPVRWDLCMEKMQSLGVTGVLELPPAGVLSGLVKRAASEIETFAIKSPEDLEAAREFVTKHSGITFSSSTGSKG
jgi:[acyl-carrier-protein] S-malonyltransferase